MRRFGSDILEMIRGGCIYPLGCGVICSSCCVHVEVLSLIGLGVVLV
jgi:hypothetical protein